MYYITALQTRAWTSGQDLRDEQRFDGMASDLKQDFLEIRLFGQFDARLNGAPLRTLRTRKGEWLLALLVLRREQQIDRGWMAGTLWPETTDENALGSLRKRGIVKVNSREDRQTHAVQESPMWRLGDVDSNHG